MRALRHFSKYCFFALGVAVVLISSSGRAEAQAIPVQWDSNPVTENVVRYYVYVGSQQNEYNEVFVVNAQAPTTTFVYSSSGGLRVYAVVAETADGVIGPLSAATSFEAFTNIALDSGLVKAVHISELRQRIDAVLLARELPAVSWTDPTLIGGVTIVKGVHIQEMRVALTLAYLAAGLGVPNFTDPALTAGTMIKAVHITELRSLVLALE